VEKIILLFFSAQLKGLLVKCHSWASQPIGDNNMWVVTMLVEDRLGRKRRHCTFLPTAGN